MSGKAKSDTRVLIIDDDADYRASTRALLEGEGYQVSEADCGRAGLEAARALNPDLIVLDIMMESPVEGYSVVQALKNRSEYQDVKQIPVLMISSVSDDPASLFAMTGEVDMITPDAYLTKPLEIPRFCNASNACWAADETGVRRCVWERGKCRRGPLIVEPSRVACQAEGAGMGLQDCLPCLRTAWRRCVWPCHPLAVLRVLMRGAA